VVQQVGAPGDPSRRSRRSLQPSHGAAGSPDTWGHDRQHDRQHQQIQVNDVQLGYYEYESDVAQAFLRPTYIIQATITEGDIGNGPPRTLDAEIYAWADATPLVAEVVSPADSVVVPAGSPSLCFSGTAQGGQPPYSYRWERDTVEEPIGTTASFCGPFVAPAPMPKRPNQVEGVRLTVTDALGTTACHYVSVVNGGTVDVEPGMIRGVWLGTPIPNPTTGGVSLQFTVPRTEHIRLRVFDVAGRVVETLIDSQVPAGKHWAWWDGKQTNGSLAGPGLYYCRLITEDGLRSRALVIRR
jgi:hypothetical protein